jgi:hypothetical protein
LAIVASCNPYTNPKRRFLVLLSCLVAYHGLWLVHARENSMKRTVRSLTLVLLLAFSQSAAAQPPAARPAEKLVTTTYDIAELVRRGNVWKPLAREYIKSDRTLSGDPVQAIVSIVMSQDPNAWREDRGGKATLEVLNGAQLEIQATAAQHKEIKELLNVLERLADIVVVLEVEIIDVDTAYFKKYLAPRLNKAQKSPGKPFALPFHEDAVKDLRSRVQISKSIRTLLPNEKEQPILSLLRPLVYQGEAGGDDAQQSILLHGVRVKLRVQVTPDRREVTLHFVQECKELLEVKEDKALDRRDLEQKSIEAPQVVETSTSTTLRVDDGVAVLVQLLYQPGMKENVRVALVRPIIRIEEEEKERKRQEEQEKKGKKN